ncbi:hypothetical protein J5N97_006337 [Dioscorea zingiberensis]|uniref:Uncharacterized protein n=1 Tax=Dioscorea zingiberensis TaxID=325984 RepID=A0A9D5D9U2_9LILI|nr:hypothetical protein J5N97_006337 [Dioscorea zingiberensis]
MPRAELLHERTNSENLNFAQMQGERFLSESNASLKVKNKKAYQKNDDILLMKKKSVLAKDGLKGVVQDMASDYTRFRMKLANCLIFPALFAIRFSRKRNKLTNQLERVLSVELVVRMESPLIPLGRHLSVPGIRVSTSTTGLVSHALTSTQRESQHSTSLCEVPPEFGRLHRLHNLNLSFNAPHGVVPINLANCSKLRVLSLASNQLSGSIPVELGQTLPKLEMLVLGNNSLTGVIPSSIGNLSSLTLLSLALNNLEGIIPEELGRLSNLISFQVAVNQFNGGNKLNGTIPASLSNASMLQIIDPSTNKFSGTVPPVFGGMNDLFILNLEENQFQASDAKDLSFIGSLVKCSTLTILSITYNNLGGVLPQSQANFSKELLLLAMDYNRFTGIIPHRIENLISLNAMDISGPIPEFLEDFKYLSVLDLSYNHFYGELPVKGVFGNSYVVLSVVGNGKRPVDERFKDGMTMRKFVEICASPDRIMEVIDPSMFSQEDDDVEHGVISVRKKIECLVSVVALGLACSVESPNGLS